MQDIIFLIITVAFVAGIFTILLVIEGQESRLFDEKIQRSEKNCPGTIHLGN